MAYFSKEFIKFFKELKKNNHKEWFDANRKRYEKEVKIPFQIFIDEMIGRINADDPEIRIEAKDAIFRINRDIRFSKDKTPYKTQVSAIISAGGKKDKSVPGVYIEFNVNEIRFYGGAHMLDKEQLHNIRSAIAGNGKEFVQLIEDPGFKKRFSEILGEQNKRLPEEFVEVAKSQPLIANKQFYYYAIINIKNLTADDLPETLMEYYFAAKPMKIFLKNAIEGEVADLA